MLFKYNKVDHVYSDYQNKLNEIHNKNLSPKEEKTAIKILKKETHKKILSESIKGIPKWKIALNWLFPLLIILAGTLIKSFFSA